MRTLFSRVVVTLAFWAALSFPLTAMASSPSEISMNFRRSHTAATALVPPEEQEQGKGEHGGHSAIFKWINFAILVGALGYVLRKPLAQFFVDRAASISKSLDEGRQALESAEAQLATVERKLKHFEEEMAAFRAEATKEMEDEHRRLRESARQEAEKLMQSIRVQMDVASKQARLELRLYGADQAVELAEKLIRERMDTEQQKKLVSQFAQRLGNGDKASA